MNRAGSNQEWQETEIGLPYYKQGEDFNFYLKKCDSLEEALELHEQNMELGVRMLRSIREIVAGRDVSMYGLVHSIRIEAEAEVIDQLVAQELAQRREVFEDEE